MAKDRYKMLIYIIMSPKQKYTVVMLRSLCVYADMLDMLQGVTALVLITVIHWKALKLTHPILLLHA